MTERLELVGVPGARLKADQRLAGEPLQDFRGKDRSDPLPKQRPGSVGLERLQLLVQQAQQVVGPGAHFVQMGLQLSGPGIPFRTG
ncbi:MAG TPA: hypothetical protein PKC50_07300, partial [Elusimicrobiota bacterium]|nr:hypothetical protein [Elusimicrobiota bacterium]